MTHIALYARVSTDRQDYERQISELKNFVAKEYPDATIERFADIISGTDDEGGTEYRRLREAIANHEVDVVIVHELSRLSRLGGGEIHEFLQHSLEHETSVRDLEVGLKLDIDDSMVDQAVTQMIAGLMGDLARIEQKQKVRRIQSGIDAAQEAGKWTGRPPTGFEVVDGYLRVDAEEYLRVRAGMERVARGESIANIADDVGVAASTLRELYNDRPELYLRGETDDDRVDAALEDVRPLGEPAAEPAENLNERLKQLEKTVENLH